MTTTITKENFYLVEMTKNKDTNLIQLILVKNIQNKLYKYIANDLDYEQCFTQLNKLSNIDKDLFKTIANITTDSLADILNNIVSHILRDCTNNNISINNSTVYHLVHNTYYALDSEHKKLFKDDYTKYIDIVSIK